MHPSIKHAFDTGSHPLAKHPIHGVYGKELANDQFNYIRDQYTKAVGTDRLDQMQMMRLLQSIVEVENPHREQLEQLAKKLVANVWKADVNLFEAELGNPGTSDTSDDEPDDELTPEQAKEVQKRITLNSLTHGAAIHQMTTLHHLIKDEVDRIDQRLMPAYDKLSRGAVYSSWFASIEQILAVMGQKGGEVQVNWEEDGSLKIKASGLILPMLVHELSKGVMEVLTAHGLPKDPETLKKVYKHADRYDAEVLHFFVGPSLWRRFLKVVDTDNLAAVVSALARQEPDHVNEIVSAVVDNPARAEEMLQALVSTKDEFDPEEYTESMINRIAELISEEPVAEPITKPETKPSDPDTKEIPDPFRPPKPAIEPRPKAKTKPATEPKVPTAPVAPDPMRPTKPSITPKPKA